MTEKCNWVEVNEWDDMSWETDCGRKWEFMADGPVENQVDFCMGCGKPVQLPAQGGQ